MTKKKKRYRLYAAALSAQTAERTQGERFVRITPDYVLLYKTGKAPENTTEITEAELFRLSAQDSRWLQDCNAALLAEAAQKNSAAVLQSLSEKLERLEQALQTEKEKLATTTDEGAEHGRENEFG